ncbi:hypothetical protein, conserved [Eimeria acervulina]|uniref:Uncharacterized protein n=1 Tax=Eimeria acervulina TaxID=5801 RepID=U6G9E4_EIMAC|nr:hypothetical protein, conserved [Eimeria acervulina]CDI76881.1 hypothetical protein, conserved [Eimeria acervulina]
MLFEAMRFALESQRARKGFSARFVAADGEGVQVQVDAQLREEGEDFHIFDTSELLAGYLEAAVNGSIGEAHELGKGRIDFSVRGEGSGDALGKRPPPTARV